MRHVNWWFIGGAVATIAISSTLGNLWSLPGLSAVGVGWGALIGSDIRESLKRAREHLPPVEYPAWIDPVFTVSVSSGLIAVGLVIGVVSRLVEGDETHLASTVILAVALGALALAGAGVLMVRRRWAKPLAEDVEV